MRKLFLLFIAILVTCGVWADVSNDPPRPSPVVLNLPADQSISQSANPNLTWTPNESEDPPIYYFVFVSLTNPPTESDMVFYVEAHNYYITPALSNNTTYYWKVIAYNANGPSLNNEIHSFTTLPEGYLDEGFESGVIPSDWTVLNEDGGESQWGAQSGSSNSGEFSAGVIYESSTLQNDDWLITPPLQLSSTDTDQISFWLGTFNQTFPEEWEALISTTDTQPSSFTMIDSGVATTYGFYQHVYNLDSYGDAIVYFAFRYRGLNDDVLFLDEFIGPKIYHIIPSPAVTITTSGEGISLYWDDIPEAAEYRIYTSDDLVNWTSSYTTIVAPAHECVFNTVGMVKQFFKVITSTELSRATLPNPFKPE